MIPALILQAICVGVLVICLIVVPITGLFFYAFLQSVVKARIQEKNQQTDDEFFVALMLLLVFLWLILAIVTGSCLCVYLQSENLF